MSRRTKNRNIIIIGLSSIVLLMAIGYAAFQTVLNIKGTSNISSTWDVQITGITKDKTKGNVTEISEPTFDKESASFKVGLESPGDYIYYKVAVTNKGSLAAIAKLGNLTCGDNNVIECGAYAEGSSTYENIGENTDLTSQRLIIGPNETSEFNIWVRYKADIEQQPNTNGASIKLELTYIQSDVGIIHTTEDRCYTGKVLHDGTISITDYNKECGTEIVIPDTIDGYIVSEIADGRYDSITSQMTSAFALKGITSVSFPNTLKRIGYAAFYGDKITNLNIPGTVEVINGYAFYRNPLKNLQLNEGLKEIEFRVFEGTGLEKVDIPNTITSLGALAFYNNNLTSIEIPPSVTALYGGVFTKNKITGESAYIYGRKSDGSIDYTVLDSFAGASATGTTIPSSVETINSYCYYTIPYREVEIPSSVKYINSGAFNSSGITNLKLNEGLKLINSNTFANNKFTTLIIPSTVTNIIDGAFNGTTTLTTININKPNGSITGSPWGATKAQINWTGTN